MHQRESRFDPRLVDAFVVAAVALPGIIQFLIVINVTADPPAGRLAAGAALTLVNAGALWWRRSHPLPVLGIALGALVLGRALTGSDATTFVVPYAATYAVAAYGSRRVAAVGLVGMVTAAALDFVIANVAAEGATAVSPTAVFMVVSWGIGRYMRVRRDYLSTLVAYAHQLEVDRDEKARRAVLEERRRIARELHDQVAHDLGIAALHTSAARRWLGRDADRASEAMASAEDALRGALTTMPAILQALRVDETASDRAPQPMLDNIDQVIAQVSDAGLEVDLQVEGERRRLDPAVELAAYRIVQEALTNTLKHARAQRSTVRLGFAADRLDIKVTDDGTGASAPSGGAGLGLIGMRERVDVLGGSLVASPENGGGFMVHATLPLAHPDRGEAQR
jgi:signal transduction histidine kinase